MIRAGVLLAVARAQAGERPDATRFLSAALTSAKGEPLQGVSIEELVVLENGVARPVTSAERDTRPLSLALLVDTSEAVRNSYRLQVVPAVLTLLAQLPQ